MSLSPAKRSNGLSQRQTNVGDVERMIFVVSGGLLLGRWLRKPTVLGLLGAGLGTAFLKRGLSGRCDVYGQLGVSTRSPLGENGIRLEESITVLRPAHEIYGFWRDLHNLAGILPHIESVEMNGDLSHWQARGPKDMTFEWDAEVLTDRANELISWKTVGEPDIVHAGSVRFREIPERGTEVVVLLRYNPPLRKAGATMASLLGTGMKREFREGLRRLKQILEAGELSTSTRSDSQQPLQLH